VSGTKLGVALAVEYGDKRRQFGPAGRPEMAILDYQAHQRRLMPALASCYALDFAGQYLVERYLQAGTGEDEGRELEVLAAGLKATASWEAMRILQTCRECCGGNGYLLANRFADLKADIDVFTTFEGDNTVLMQLVARGLLTSYRQQFSDLKIASVLRYVAQQASRVLAENNPIASRQASEEHLRDPGVIRSLFKSREDHLLINVARRLKSLIDSKMDSFLAFNACQDHLIALSRAYIERVIVEQFQRRVESAPRELKPALQDLCDLYSLSRLYEDRAYFLEHGHFEPVKSKAVRQLMLKLCAEVRPQALGLVRGFGIPASLMDVPMLDAC
jgi:acyl-CoA oxidase